MAHTHGALRMDIAATADVPGGTTRPGGVTALGAPPVRARKDRDGGSRNATHRGGYVLDAHRTEAAGPEPIAAVRDWELYASYDPADPLHGVHTVRTLAQSLFVHGPAARTDLAAHSPAFVLAGFDALGRRVDRAMRATDDGNGNGDDGWNVLELQRGDDTAGALLGVLHPLLEAHGGALVRVAHEGYLVRGRVVHPAAAVALRDTALNPYRRAGAALSDLLGDVSVAGAVDAVPARLAARIAPAGQGATLFRVGDRWYTGDGLLRAFPGLGGRADWRRLFVRSPGQERARPLGVLQCVLGEEAMGCAFGADVSPMNRLLAEVHAARASDEALMTHAGP